MATADLRPVADYIIVGGGTSGLVVACRLSENPDVHVVVLESGPDGTKDERVMDPAAYQSLEGSELDWKLKYRPQPSLNDRVLDNPAGKVLGGSSAINGMIYIAPSPAGIDAWAHLGNPKWTWEKLAPYMRKSITLNVPETHPEIKENQRNPSTGPIQITYPSLTDISAQSLLGAWNDAFKARGHSFNPDILGEQQTLGPRPYAATIDPVSGLRSASHNQYAAVASARPNVSIVTEATVRRILFDTNSLDAVASGVEFEYYGQVSTIQASNEIILAAGTFHTPKVLELSGVGDKERLESLGIPVIIDQPAVGTNLQNHLMSVLPVPLKPHSDLEDITPGIQSLSMASLDSDEQNEILAAHSSEIKGTFEETIQSIIQNPHEASSEFILGLVSPQLAIIAGILSFPFSRGHVHISSADPYVPPEIDAQVASKEIDLDILARHMQNLHEFIRAEALNQFFQETVTVPDIESIKEGIRASGQLAHHACGTAAMLPREKGGVVDEDLRVYGTRNLRIVDASIFPLIPHANPIATVYAVAERAADLIR
ncbi:glucose-methanol-choline (gmc) oxidoreductase [Penicillium macrosclerotiorum]|uniref:glucose-methanol-choline (gmc) oxidoreductase n=1 Tax=Penicillium macrosclerotiorum TaxID=303699 RepID=UPI002548F926|nr:glucose-methanol-choline (gmc) oxidoreductase [Penicillium macrosclerotiorum]KAJ5669804.1 glucose-methanol-choline (gmc) oxidoreductase [Penicillium macrosclerotiorum]